MQIQIVAKHVTDKEKYDFNKYLEKKLPRLEKLATHFAHDAAMLLATIEHFEKHDAYKITLKLDVPSTTLVAEESSHSITKAMDDSVDRLVAQLKKHIEKLQTKHRNIEAVI
jgi:ribosomal subunit interface protein